MEQNQYTVNIGDYGNFYRQEELLHAILITFSLRFAENSIMSWALSALRRWMKSN